MRDNGFVRRMADGVAVYACCAFEDIAGLRHGFSTRHGGVSTPPEGALNLGHVPWDTAEHVRENRRRFCAALGLGPARLLTLRQIHSDRTHILREISDHWNPPEGDAISTDQAGAALAVQTADCFPVLLADRETRVVACVHSGWKGTLAQLVSKTIGAMHRAFAIDITKLLVAVGPGIRSCCYEVGEEVAELYRGGYPGADLLLKHAERPGKYLLDLPAALHRQFAGAGIPAGNIHDLGACTRCRVDEFFSYRAEGLRAGRMMAVIGRVA